MKISRFGGLIFPMLKDNLTNLYYKRTIYFNICFSLILTYPAFFMFNQTKNVKSRTAEDNPVSCSSSY